MRSAESKSVGRGLPLPTVLQIEDKLFRKQNARKSNRPILEMDITQFIRLSRLAVHLKRRYYADMKAKNYASAKQIFPIWRMILDLKVDVYKPYKILKL